MTPPSNRGGGPSRVVVDPVTLEPCGFIVTAETSCTVCGAGRLIEVYDDGGELVRRVAEGQLCWHWRANQLSTATPSVRGGVDKTSKRC